MESQATAVQETRFTGRRGNNIRDLFYVRLFVYALSNYPRANLITIAVTDRSPGRRESSRIKLEHVTNRGDIVSLETLGRVHF